MRVNQDRVRDAAISAMQDGVIVLDAADQVVEINPAARRLLGLGDRGADGVTVGDLLAGWPVLLSELHQPSGRGVSLDIGGQEVHVEVEQNPLTDPDGVALGRVVVLHDVSHRLASEQTLQEANELLITLRQVDEELARQLDLRYVATLALDAAIRVSAADAGFIGLAQEDGAIRVVHGVGQGPSAGLILAPGLGISGRALRLRRAERVLDVSQDPDYMQAIPTTRAQMSVPLFSGEKLVGLITLESKRPERFTEQVFDAVQLMASRVAVAIDNAVIHEERGKLVAELEAFAYTVAHDLKNPLSSVVGYLDLLLNAKGEFPAERQERFLRTALHSAQKGIQIIESLLMLSRIRKGQTLEIVSLEMGHVVSEVLTRMTLQIDQHQAQITLPDAWLAAQGYAPWVEEIWANYLSNALKYGGKPPVVELGCDPAVEGQVRFWVRDNGHGLTPEQQARLFRPFTRLGHSDVEGHGLGLSIVQRIAEKLGGTVGVESAPDEGSRFYFTLPAA